MVKKTILKIKSRTERLIKQNTMCFNIRINKDPEYIKGRFRARFEPVDWFQKQTTINGFTFPKTPVIAHNKPDVIQPFTWGLIPFWAKDNTIQQYTLNAKIETLAEKPSFKNSINKRCLVIADGFYEWQWLDPKGKKKQKYLITLPNDELFAFGGIWSEWVNKATGEILNTYTIVTTQANELMSEIHNSKKRMPVILTPENESDWLKGADTKEFEKIKIELIANPL